MWTVNLRRGTTLSSAMMISSNFNLHNKRMLIKYLWQNCYWDIFFSFQFAKVFLVIQNFLSWKTAWPFILTVFNSQFLRMLFAIFCWNWPSGSITNVTIKKRAYVQTIVHVACKKRCVLIFESVPLRL